MKKKSKPFCILFAGPGGCSKTPTANFLSLNLYLPVLRNDSIRIEVIEDIGEFDNKIYFKRRDERFIKILSENKSFIYDASIDRRWSEIRNNLEKYNYRWFIVSFNLSFQFLEKINSAKQYTANKKLVDRWHQEHQDFLEKYKKEVGLVIDNNNFKSRLDKTLKAVKEFM